MELNQTKSAYLLDRRVKPITAAVNMVAVVFLLAMTLLTAADVCGRYFVSKPILGAFEVTSLMLVIVVFGGMAYAVVTKTHVSVDAVVHRLSPQGQAMLGSVTSVASLVFFILVSWQAVALSNLQRSKGYLFGTVEIPTWPFPLIIAIGSALVCVAILPAFLQHLAVAWKGGLRFRLGLFFGIAFFLLICALSFWGAGFLPWKMSQLMVGVAGLVFMVAIMLCGIWIGTAMGLAAILGVAYISGIDPVLGLIGIATFGTVVSYTLAVIPLFILMGEFAHHAELSKELYFTVYKWLGHLPGGLAMASVGACAGFAAVSGSSVATAATMGTVAIPEMRRYKYDAKLATGAVAAGGTIGILIPPSIILVLYGIMAEQNIGELFIAGFIPGVLEAVFYMITIYILCKRNPLIGPPGASVGFTEKITAFKDTWPVLALFLLVIGGMYLGIFTPTEAAGVGAFGAFVLVAAKRRLSRQTLTKSLVETGKTTAMVFLFLIGVGLLGYFLALGRLPYEIAEFVAGLEVNRYLILGGILLTFFILGCFMSSLALILLTVPIFLPLIMEMGFSPIWYGIMMVRVCEIGSITPPVGLSVFVIKGVVPDIPIGTIFRGIVPFLIADLCHVAMLAAFPQIALFLPSLMY